MTTPHQAGINPQGSPCPCRGCIAAYNKGYADASRAAGKLNSEQINAAFREGYNAHAAGRRYAEAVYGPYPKQDL